MGVGAAASEPGTLSMIHHLFVDRSERARALGVWTAVSGLALALGPVMVTSDLWCRVALLKGCPHAQALSEGVP
jgi:hypothetical protein